MVGALVLRQSRETRPQQWFIRNTSPDLLTGWKPPSGGLQESVGHVTETVGHVPEFGGHDAETGGHDDPKYAAQASVVAAVHELPALSMQVVQGRGAASRLWNEYVARYHYLGYTPMSGSQIRYSVHAGDRLVAFFSAPAPARGRWPTASASSAGILSSARESCNSSSTTRAS